MELNLDGEIGLPAEDPQINNVRCYLRDMLPIGRYKVIVHFSQSLLSVRAENFPATVLHRIVTP